METEEIELTELEILRGKPMPSRNHSILEVRISHLIMEKYDDKYDVLTELDLDLTTGTSIPDICIYNNLTFDFEDDDVLKMTEPPLTAIEILSPRQAYDVLTKKIRKMYFPAGVKSAWIVMPSVRTIQLFVPDQPIRYFNIGIFKDPTNGIELDIAAIFK